MGIEREVGEPGKSTGTKVPAVQRVSGVYQGAIKFQMKHGVK